jgi:DNA-binding NarL/FixJ family response regulator
MPERQPTARAPHGPCRIVIVDHRASTRESLAALPASRDGLHVCASATGTDDGLAAVREHRPDLVIADGGADAALDLVRHLRNADERVPVLVYAGSDGAAPAEVVRAIAALVAAGGDGGVAAHGDGTSVASLSPRELQAFELMGRGLVTPVIAKQMEVSPKTVETYRARIKHKLGLVTYTELIQRAAAWVIDRR